MNAQELLHRGEQGAWQLAAVTSALQAPRDSQLRAAATAVLTALGLREEHLAASEASLEQVAAQASAPLLQTASVISGGGVSWSQQPDSALLAQGRASAQGARAFAELALPHLGDFHRQLSAPGARMLDVGTGVGALAVAYAELFPALQVLGIDVSERVLRLAASTVAENPAGRRVEIRLLDVADLEDEAGFDLVWVPAPFLPEPALRQGVARIARVLRPGGWLMFAHGKYGADPVDDAVNRFKTVAFGGTPLDDAEAEAMLTAAGFATRIRIPTPAGAPAIVLAHAGEQEPSASRLSSSP